MRALTWNRQKRNTANCYKPALPYPKGLRKKTINPFTQEYYSEREARIQFGDGPLYPPELIGKFDLFDIFKYKGWHPGKMSQKNNDCLPHSLNMLVGGPLFTTRGEFSRLYAARRKTSFLDAREDIRLWGVSLKTLRKIIYDPNDNKWFKLILKYVIKRDLIDTYIFSNDDDEGLTAT